MANTNNSNKIETDLFDAVFNVEEPPQPASISSSPLLGSPGPSSSGAPANQIDLGVLLSTATETETQIWMVQKNNLDHGPFSTRELGQQIFSGKVNPDDQVLNMDTGVRQRCVVWPEFTQIVEKAMEKRRQEQEAEALRKVETVEKGVGVARYFIALGIIVAVGVLIGGYFIYRHATRSAGVDETNAGDLIAAGGQMIKTGAGVLPIEEQGSRRRGRGRHRSGGGGSGGGPMSAEEAMNQAADYGNLTGEATQLSVGQITSVMNRNVRGLAGCMGGEGGRVNLDIVINGDGSVAGVTVQGPSGGVASCIQSRARGIRFPAFGAPRMRASYFFEVGR